MYNVAPFVERCIRSLEDQDIPKDEYEIICINDGSPDNCREIVEQLQQEFPNIILINQDNQGVSMARNNAIARANGIYILPVDPDDYVLANTFHYALNKANTNDLDVLFLKYQIINENGTRIWSADYSDQQEKILTGEFAYFFTRALAKGGKDRSWGILYKKSLLDQYSITYPKEVPYLEDGVFLGKILLFASKVGYNNKMFYNFIKRPGSATASKLLESDKAAIGFINAVGDLLRIKDTKLEENQTLLLNHLIARYTLLVLMPSASSRNLSVFKKRFKQLYNYKLRKINIKGVRGSKRLFSIAYNISPYCYFIVKQMQLVHKLTMMKIKKPDKIN